MVARREKKEEEQKEEKKKEIKGKNRRKKKKGGKEGPNANPWSTVKRLKFSSPITKCISFILKTNKLHCFIRFLVF